MTPTLQLDLLGVMKWWPSFLKPKNTRDVGTNIKQSTKTHLWLKNRLSRKAYLEISHHVYGLSTQEFCWKLAIGNKTTAADLMVYQLWSCKQSLFYCYSHVFCVIQLRIKVLAPNGLPFPNLPWNHGLTCGLLAVFVDRLWATADENSQLFQAMHVGSLPKIK